MSKIVPVQNLVNPSKYSLKCPYSMNPTRIVVHNTANDASARNEISYMINNNSSTSFHFAVDGNEVVQGIPLDRNAHHAGDGVDPVRSKGNREGIGIEICYSLSGGDRFTAAEKNAAKFIAQLLDERGWGIEKVTKHQDYSGKYCPHRTLNLGWNRFLNMIKSEMAAQEPEVPEVGEYEVVVTCNGYYTSSDAIARNNPRSIVNPGKYFIYNKVTGAVNVTKNRKTPGSWINTNDNVKTVHTETTVFAGRKLDLNQTNLYSSSTSTRRASTVSGTYYCWDGTIVNKKVRITTPYSNVGKSGQVTGWINVSDAMSQSQSYGPQTPTTTTAQKSVNEIAKEVINGKWGNGSDRVARLRAAGYDPSTVQNEVNRILLGTSIKVGDKVMFNTSANYWSTGQKIPSWVKNSVLYVRSSQTVGGTVLVSILKTGAITGSVKVSSLHKI